MKPGLCKGKLVRWQDERGFGFIQPAGGGKDVFLHISELKDATRRPQTGDTIYYYVVPDSNAPGSAPGNIPGNAPGNAPGGKVRASNAFIAGARRPPAERLAARPAAVRESPPARAFPLVEVGALAILPLIGSLHLTWTMAMPLPLILYPVMSVLTFMLYASDKARAQQQKWRISERTLHFCELAGGWLGGLIAQRRLSHKSTKASYQAEFWLIVGMHQVGWLGWLFFGKLWLGQG